MASYHIQTATSAQQKAIKALVRAVRINPLGLNWGRFVVAMDNGGNLIGCGQVKPHRDGSWELASIAVAPDWRGQGVAGAIIRHLLGSGLQPLWLTCVSTLVPFYISFGFHEITSRAQMLPYFRFVSQLFDLWSRLFPSANRLSVMRYTGILNLSEQTARHQDEENST